MQLTAHFTLEEFTMSDTAIRAGIENIPDSNSMANLRMLAQSMEKVRTVLTGLPIHINSGYRSAVLNAKVGGAKMSAHLDGMAADFICPAFGSPLDVCRAIAASDLHFDQVIHEFGSWCHFAIAYRGIGGRRELLTIETAAAGYQKD